MEFDVVAETRRPVRVLPIIPLGSIDEASGYMMTERCWSTTSWSRLIMPVGCFRNLALSPLLPGMGQANKAQEARGFVPVLDKNAKDIPHGKLVVGTT
jgi:hypothetical protein